MRFSDNHLIIKFNNISEKRDWWMGRLVILQTPSVGTIFVKSPTDEVGIVVGIVESIIGEHAKVYFSSISQSSWILTTYLLTQED